MLWETRRPLEDRFMTRLTSLRLLVAFSLIVVFTSAAMVASQRSATAMATAANTWLGSLTPEQKAQATFAFDSEERMRWHFIPTWTFARKGITIKEMTPQQLSLAQQLLKTGLSQKGYATATAIMDLETVLRAIE